jgi:methionine-rich copper-binding protein CopC
MAPTALLSSTLALAAVQVQAHANLVSADPAPNSTVAAPKLIELHFSEEIAKKLSNFKLIDTGGKAVAYMAMDAKDAKSLAGMPNGALAAGPYTVTWIAVSTDDGHKMTGSYSFTVK